MVLPGAQSSSRDLGAVGLTALGALSLIGYGTAAVGLAGDGSARDVVQFLGLFSALFALYFVAVWLTRRTAAAPGWSIQILVWAFLFRLALLPAGLPPATWAEGLAADLRGQEVSYRSFLLYDNDIWRYLWDGHVFGSGLDPYARSPSELEQLADAGDPAASGLFEEELWRDVFDRVSYEGYRTVYPPVTQWLFRLVHWLAPGSVFAWKLVVMLFDFGSCLLLWGLLRTLRGRPGAVALYAWNPLVLKELAGSGHVDAVMIFFLLLSARLLLSAGRRQTRAAWGLAAYGLAVLSKITPILLAGLVLRRVRVRHWWLLAAVLAAGYWPFVGSLEAQARAVLAFSREWVFNPGPWLVVEQLVGAASGLDGRVAANLVAYVVTAALVVWCFRRDDGGADRLILGAFLVLGGFVLFSATVMPWYLLWALPFAALRAGTGPSGGARPEAVAWAALTGLSLLSYLIFIDQVEHRWWLWVEYGGFLAVLGWRARWWSPWWRGRVTRT